MTPSKPSTSASPYIPSPIPSRTNQSIPRPPPPSPLRPGSPSSLPATPRRTGPLNSPAVNTSSAPSTPPPQNKTRARDLLRKHYGLGVGPPPTLRSDSNGKVNDPMDLGDWRNSHQCECKSLMLYLMLDSTAFDAKTYYEQLITTSSLPTLLKRENDLLTGVYAFSGPLAFIVFTR